MSSVKSFHSAVYLLLMGAIFGMAHLCAWGQDSTQEMIAAPPPLITEAIDESRLTTLKGNTYPLARPEFDLGTAPATLPMQRMLLVLKRSPQQETALEKLLDDQQDKNSVHYHKWMSPEQFGKQFGPTDSDIQVITNWLQSHGFEVGATKGRSVLEFSGSASQVREAFHTTIHKYLVNGEQHWANASDPQIPTALTPAVAGVLTLHNFVKKPQIHWSKTPVAAKVSPAQKEPEVTFGDGTHALGPDDFAIIYNSPDFNSDVGPSPTIGIVGRSDLYNDGQDISNFELDAFHCCDKIDTNRFHIILNGPDPGDAGGSEEAEATLDVTWSAAAGPPATVDFVVSATTNTTDGIDLSELYIIENNLADIMTESFGSCESGQSAEEAGISGLAEQAAVQGITYFVSTGDSGAEACDNPNSETVATHPVSVNILASTPFNVAVGGTMFNEGDAPNTYWGSANNYTGGSVLSYIPEDVWNESCPVPCASPNIRAGGGGASTVVPKPSWQSGVTNIPNDNARDLPDVSLTAASHDPYLLCLEGSCVPNNQGQFSLYLVWGTSASAPSFAGIMSIVDQQMANTTGTLRQGAANYVLYRLAASENATLSQCNASKSSSLPAGNCIFNDVTVGNNAVPGEINYGSLAAQYQAGVGYDLASGLGSVNITNLINNWNTVTFNPSTTAFVLNGGTNAVTINHGQSATVGATVTPNSGTATPTGSVILYTSNGIAPSTLDLFHLSSGQASGSTSALPGSGNAPYNVWAHYSGDDPYAPSDSNKISVTVNPESSTTTLTLQATDLIGNPLTSPFPFGSIVFVRADVAGNSGHGIPTGSVSFSDTFGSLPSLNPQVNPPVQVVSNPALNSQGNTSIGDGIISFDAGNHSISASYTGDPSFSASNSTTPVTFSVQPGFAVVSGPTPVSISAPGATGRTTAGIVASTGFSTAITFTCSNLPSEATCSALQATGQGPNAVVNTTITVTTTAPHTTMLHSNERRYYYAVLLAGGLPLAGIFFVAAPRRRRWSIVVGLMMFALLVMVPACGGGGGGGSPAPQQDPGTPAGTYIVTLTATAGTLTQSGAFTLVVQ